MAGQAGFFDTDERLAALSAAGDPLERLSAVVDFELFRPELEAALVRRARQPAAWPGGEAVNLQDADCVLAEREKPLRLEMSFEKALARFGQADPAELPDRCKLGRKAGGRSPPAARVDGKGEGDQNRRRKPGPPVPTG